MKFLKWLFIILIIIIGAALIIALFLPKQVKINAKINIDKPAAQLFHSIASFDDRQEWDPWVSEDSTTKVNVLLNENYIGSSYSWDGEKVKTGKIIVNEIEYGKSILASISFGNNSDPATVSWSFSEENGSTLVNWGFESELSWPVGRIYMALGKSMMLKYFNTGLENLKKHIEKKEITLSSLTNISIVTMPAISGLFAGSSGTMAEITPFYAELFGKVYETMTAQGLEPYAPPLSFYYNYDQESEIVSVLCGMQVKEEAKSEGEVIYKSFPEVKALKGIHTGPYSEFNNSYKKLMKYAEENELELTWESFEIYLTDPGMESIETLWKTEIYFPLK